MLPGLSNDILCHTTSYSFNSQTTRSDIRPHIKWAVSLRIVDGQFDLPRVFVGMYGLTYHNHFYHTKVTKKRGSLYKFLVSVYMKEANWTSLIC